MIDFAVVICTYNGEKTIAQAIESILHLIDYQRLVREVFLVDNASTDSTKEICLSYVDDKVKYKYEAKPGLSNARKRAIETDAEWVLYVDDDNILSEDWLVIFEGIIKEHDRLGVINGAVVASPVEQLTKDEEIRLELMHRNLACTHIYNINNSATKNDTPMGAGMCIRTSALKKVYEDGWLQLRGRTGTNLSSGEDTELCDKVFAQGYTYFCTYDTYMLHLIPKSRLSKEYTDRLLKGLIGSRYDLISQSKYYLVARFLRMIKYFLCLAVNELRSRAYKSPLKKEQCRENIVVAKQFIHRVVDDRLVRR